MAAITAARRLSLIGAEMSRSPLNQLQFLQSTCSPKPSPASLGNGPEQMAGSTLPTFTPELAKLCETCSVLGLNDEQLAGHIRDNPDASSFVDLWAAYDTILEGPLVLPVEWQLVDSLPEMLRLKENVERGCEFCRILRLMIAEARFEFTGCINISLCYTKTLAALVAFLEPQDGSFSRRDFCSSRIIFTLETDCEPVGSWLRIPRPRAQQTLCESSVVFMKESIRFCEEVCCHPTFADHTPTRLIDVGSGVASGTIRLVDTNDLAPSGSEAAPRYAALSYCWGTSEDAKTQLRTTAATLAAHKVGISEGLMTRVLLEAVQVCRSVSIRYLWADALCIVQDDATDWELESSRMALIYNNAVVTLAAIASNSCHQSFLERRLDHISLPFTSQINPSVSGHYGLYGSACVGRLDSSLLIDTGNAWTCPWTVRGWTMQEAMMPRSMILFGNNFIHHTCLPRYGRENRGFTKSYPRSFRQISEIVQHNSSSPDLLRIYDSWDGLLQNFLPRRLSHIQDKLPAISGLAKCFAEVAHDTYLAGVWRGDLPFGLLWFPRDTTLPGNYANFRYFVDQIRHSDPYIVPSWSPARLAGTFCSRSILGERLRRQDFSARCAVIEARTAVEGDNPFGKVSGGSIRIRGRLGKVPSELFHLYCSYDAHETRYLVDEGRLVAYCNGDYRDDEEIWAKDGMVLLLLGTSQASASYLAESHLGGEELWTPCHLEYVLRALHRHAGDTREALHPTEKEYLPSRECSPIEDTIEEGKGVREDAESDDDRNPAGNAWRSLNRGLGSASSSERTSCLLSPAASVREAPSDHGEPERPSSGQSESGEPSLADDGSDASFSSNLSRIKCPIDEAFEDVDEDWFEDNEDAWGLLLAPAAEEGKYIRVGAWRSIVGDGGGSRYFAKYETHEVEIV